MRTLQIGLLVAVIAFAGLAPASAQDEGNQLPIVTITGWEVIRIDGTVFTVYDRDLAIGSFSAISGFTHHELDTVRVSYEVFDPDWIEEDNPDNPDAEQNTEDEEVFVRTSVTPLENTVGGDLFGFFGGAGASPDAPPVPQSGEDFFGVDDSTGFRPTDNLLTLTYTFVLPNFIGANQLRLRGEIDYDVRYFVEIDASNDSSPEDDAIFFGSGSLIEVVESPFLLPANPPAFADAGADQTAAVNTLVILDGSRTFDGFNVGFDTNDDDNIFEKDIITFAWEWLSSSNGVRLDPVQNSARSPFATIEPTIPGTYVYRLLVDDGSNPRPTTDTVTVNVVESLPVNRAPTAVIVGPANAVSLGTLVTLDGGESTDPDDDQLRYIWRQTNELGDPLSAEELEDSFLPLSGLDAETLEFQALTTGEFYFRLIVDDGEFSATTTFSIEIVESTAGITASNETTSTSSASGSDSSALGGADAALAPLVPTCGAGLMPVALAPLALFGFRGRRRMRA